MHLTIRLLYSITMLLGVVVASEVKYDFNIGKTTRELKEIYVGSKIVPITNLDMAFEEKICGIDCVVIYRIETDVSVSVLYYVKTERTKYLDAAKNFAILTKELLKDCKIIDVIIRINGTNILGTDSKIETPLHYVRIEAITPKGFSVSARLDGSFNTLAVEDSDVTNFTIAVNSDTINVQNPMVIIHSAPP